MKKIPIDPAVQFLWALANAEACFSGELGIRPIHFFLAFLNVLDDAFQQDAEHMGIPPEGMSALLNFAAFARVKLGINDEAMTKTRRSIKRQLRSGISGRTQVIQMLHRTEPARALFRQAAKHAANTGREYLDLYTLWDEILHDLPLEAAVYFPAHDGNSSEKIVLPITHSQETGWQFLEASAVTKTIPKTPQLDQLGRDLTALAKQGCLPQVVGREKEMKTMARFLLRTVKRGIMLIGEAGVGKSALVEGLAQKGVSAEGPDFLRPFRFIQLNVADLISGTKYRGDLEKRLTALIAEAEADPNLILFIDEIHRVIPDGGSSEIADLLKPALARDKLRCIGATTNDEFERHIRPDTAFMRRFQVVSLTEPKQDETLKIAEAWAQRIENLQAVSFEPGAVAAAVKLSGQWMQGRAWPDSAIDLLENSATFALVSSLSNKVRPLKKGRPGISPALMEAVLEEVWGIPIHPKQTVQINEIETRLKDAIVGQEVAIKTIAESFLEPNSLDKMEVRGAGLTLLLTGPTGVGKTYAVASLAETLFGKETKALLRLQMSELKERHELARLIGAPPGFIGHAQEPLLFQFARAHPKGLILLDELDKAHPEIHDYFLQIFDQGSARDSHGRQVDFKQMVFIATCNVLLDETEEDLVGFLKPEKSNPLQNQKQQYKALRRIFRPEFLARFHKIIPFQKLTQKHFEVLFLRQIQAFSEHLQSEQEIGLEIDEKTKQAITRYCEQNNEGARGFLRRLEQTLFVPIKQYLKDVEKEKNVKVFFKNGKIILFS